MSEYEFDIWDKALIVSMVVLIVAQIVRLTKTQELVDPISAIFLCATVIISVYTTRAAYNKGYRRGRFRGRWEEQYDEQ